MKNNNKNIIFASEIKAILANPMVKAQVDRDGITELFALGPAVTPGKTIYKNISEINETPAGYTDNGMILLGDICTVKYVTQERKTFFNLNGKDAVSLSIFKKNEVSPSKLSNAVKAEIEELKNIYGDSYEFTILIDKSDQLKDSLQQLCVSVFF